MRGKWMKLGEICIRAGLASADVVDYLLRRQHQTGQPLGDLAVASGLVPAPQMNQLLFWQQSHCQGEPLPRLERPVYRAVW